LAIKDRLFFPRCFHPVLDGGIRDEDAVITPQVPTGGTVGQGILDDEEDGQPLDTVGVGGFGCGKGGQVSGEATTATPTTMARERDEEIERPAGACVPEVV
jgi:hypothetical protein